MSLASLCGVSTGTIKRKNITKDASGGDVAVYDVATRGSLPTTITFRRNSQSSSRRMAYAQHDEIDSGTLYTITNPKCDERDVVEMTTSSGAVEQLFIQAQTEPDNVNKFWVLRYAQFGRGIQ